eukprot:CAMPEP_0185846952 /NCGR_PEP_ID=MMETSP1354-20130828/2408_1 /TAXON_ID=708628 /ORGANISM="Erythrolobus madagascarensis, Strain CCMP3276" /LENGTH=56 /DNA_ID=CAMNT_0028547183 /DNA_START=336 /DNA_END=503 /DNA_ORIENTATION=+
MPAGCPDAESRRERLDLCRNTSSASLFWRLLLVPLRLKLRIRFVNPPPSRPESRFA